SSSASWPWPTRASPTPPRTRSSISVRSRSRRSTTRRSRCLRSWASPRSWPAWSSSWSARGGDGAGSEARLQARLHGRPLRLENREVHGIALVAPHVHVLAQHALAHGAQPRDRLLGAHVAAVGLQRHAYAAERLEAIGQEQQLRFRVGGRAPVVAGEKRRAD